MEMMVYIPHFIEEDEFKDRHWWQRCDCHKIEPGVYRGNNVVDLLRKHAGVLEKIHFIADMMEE